MQQRRALPFEAPEGGILFTLKDITYTPEAPRKDEPFTVKGKVELFGIPFLAPVWVIAKVTYPERWWEEIIPIIGSPTVGEGQMALGGDFEINFPKGFDREGEFLLEVEVHAGPTYTLDSITLPPFPPMASEETTFLVSGEVPPEEIGFRGFTIKRYGTVGKEIEAPGVIELETGEILRIIVGFDHMGDKVTGEFHAAIWQKRPWDPHDEILNAERAFSVEATADWHYFEDYIDIPITSAISPGSEYGLYVKIMGITGGDIFTEYLANVITIIGVPPAAFRFAAVIINGSEVTLTDHDVDSGLMLPKTTTDYLDINPHFEWQGPAKSANISIKAGYRDWTGGFTPKTGAYTATIYLPESPEPFQGQLNQPITVPLTACGDIDDGAIEVVLKIAGEPDYISHIWNVYATKEVAAILKIVDIKANGGV